MKKYLSLALAGLLAISMTACGGIAADLAAMVSPKAKARLPLHPDPRLCSRR